MYLLSALSLSVAAIFAVAVSVDFAPLSDAEIEYINSLEGNTWKAGRNFAASDLDRVKRLLGVDIEANAEYNKLHLSYPKMVYPDGDLPATFDARKNWPKCATIKDIRDQSNCGSCWAFGSVEAQSDRHCTIRNITVRLSPEDVLSCCEDCSGSPGKGCLGGFPASAYDYWRKTGVVSGGPYGSKDTCYPYEIPPCHTPTPNCTKLHATPQCTRKCIPGYPKSFEQDKHYGEFSYAVKGVELIMKELVNNGPVTAAFMVFSDFMSYKSGVYKHVSEQYLGGHAVKIIGYGTEDGQDYWLVANSWGTAWGMQGFFKIAKGSDECQIEDAIVAGIPQK
ncbi:hypothetical protein RRG08_045672 [Elysia crispata]|uniref:Cathepsin B-like cysteine proteinase n=1 Tax=Elysia crispata TaxID=231223 RepID=A0AAE1D989_9GAST|nr:hypothetical protein RRG08_045672 [Elysia crispata]